MTRHLVLLLTSALLASCGAPRARTEHVPRSKVGLGVVVVFDQVPYGLMEHLTPLFGDDGFGGLSERNSAQSLASFEYGNTKTATGHATLLTGVNPSIHGVLGNRWYDGRTKIHVADDPDTRTLGYDQGSGVSAHRLMAPTLGDALKEQTSGRARVVTLSVKSRAAVMSAGRKADMALFYDKILGRYTTSTAYASELPDWLGGPARRLPEEALATAAWSPLPIPAEHAQLFEPDDRGCEVPPAGWSRTFPHDLPAIAEAKHARAAYRYTPRAMSDLFELALVAQEGFALGHDGVPDLLVVSISSTDYSGHAFGPYSRESADLLRRADEALAGFVAELDRRLGKDAYVLAVSSDHGAPRGSECHGPEGGTTALVPAERLMDAAEHAIRAELGAAPDGGRWTLGIEHGHLYLYLDGTEAPVRDRVIDLAAAAVASDTGIARTFPARAEIAGRDPLGAVMMGGFYAPRSGQILVLPKPGWCLLKPGDHEASNHGTPYAYDREVSLILRGPGVRPGRLSRKADARDLVPTLARLLGVEPPEGVEGRVLDAVQSGSRQSRESSALSQR